MLDVFSGLYTFDSFVTSILDGCERCERLPKTSIASIVYDVEFSVFDTTENSVEPEVFAVNNGSVASSA